MENDVVKKRMLAAAEKAKGNTFFGKRDYRQAIEHYSKAISYEPTVSVYYSNRGLCFLKMDAKLSTQKSTANGLESENDDTLLPTPRGGGSSEHYMFSGEIERDASKALELDKHNPKANYLLGIIAKRNGNAEATVQYMQVAVEGSKRQKKSKSFITHVENILRQAKYERWMSESEKKLRAVDSMRSYVKRAMSAYKKMQMETARAKLDTDMIKPDDHAQQIEEIEQEHEAAASLLDVATEEFSERHCKEGVVPDYFCDMISLRPMLDPVTTPAGRCYERQEILNQIAASGIDPITRAPIQPYQIRSCFNMKQAVEAFLEDNQWAYGEVIDEDNT